MIRAHPPPLFLEEQRLRLHTAQRTGAGRAGSAAEQEGQQSPSLPVPSLSEVPAEPQYLTRPQGMGPDLTAAPSALGLSLQRTGAEGCG